jgi:hypothetical protein
MRNAILSAAVFLAWTPTARATTVSFTDFADTSPLTLSGDAKKVDTSDGWVLRLTPAVANQNGSAFGTVTINAAQFYSTFAFRMSEPGGTAPDSNGRRGADGITFAIQNVSASLGSRGGGLGIEGVNPSVAIEFDTYKNDNYKDPGSNHIGINVNGVVTSVATVDVGAPFNDGNTWYAWIDCDASTLTVSVSQDGVRPETPQLSYPVNVEQTLGSAFAHVGFTAATGGGFQNHDILSWVYLDHFVSADAGVPALDGGDLPGAGGADAGGPPDATPPDGADAGTALDAASQDGGADGGDISAEAGDNSPERRGCACDVGGERASLLALGAASALLMALRARRRSVR